MSGGKGRHRPHAPGGVSPGLHKPKGAEGWGDRVRAPAGLGLDGRGPPGSLKKTNRAGQTTGGLTDFEKGALRGRPAEWGCAGDPVAVAGLAPARGKAFPPALVAMPVERCTRIALYRYTGINPRILTEPGYATPVSAAQAVLRPCDKRAHLDSDWGKAFPLAKIGNEIGRNKVSIAEYVAIPVGWKTGRSAGGWLVRDGSAYGRP